MLPEAIVHYITRTFAGVAVTEDTVNRFFSYEPGANDLPARGFLPFATLVMNDAYDQASQLERDGIFRLNVGLRAETYRAWFGPQPAAPGDAGVVSGHDFAALDQLMPHPVYASRSWVCVLSPSASTFEAVKPLLAEAYHLAARRHNARVKRK